MKKLFTLISVLCLLTLTGCAKSNEQTVSATAKGYGGDITVTLTVKDDKITDVKIVGDGETKDVGSKAVEQMPEQILSDQTYDVDGVSGATISSTSIKKATKEAGLLANEEGSSACGIDGSLDLDAINEFLNTSADMGEGSIANAVAIIPINHINGPRDEHDFYAFVNFKYKARNYIKYQITYLSCTCRSADVNYWMTAYVELTLPDSGNIEDSKIRTLSFDYDAEGHYLAGFWGDSNPTPAGNTYEEFKEQYIPFFVGKDYAYIKTLDVVEDIDPSLYAEGEGRD